MNGDVTIKCCECGKGIRLGSSRDYVWCNRCKKVTTLKEGEVVKDDRYND